MNEKERRDFREEIRSQKIVQKKLESAIRALDKQIAAIDRKKRKEALSQYKDEQDLQDAYGSALNRAIKELKKQRRNKK